jgi:peroxiredoxin
MVIHNKLNHFKTWLSKKIRVYNLYLVPAAILIAAIIISIGIVFKNSANFQVNISPDQIRPQDFRPLIDFYAPLFSLKTSRGTEIKLEDLRGQNILLVFWSTQCNYSAQELNDLKEFTQNHRGQILVLAINYIESPAIIKEYEQKENINFPILIDEKGLVANAYKIEGTPSHFLLDKQGKIVSMLPSYASSFNLGNMLQSFNQ